MENPAIQEFDWTRLDDRSGYQAWRSAKLRQAEAVLLAPPIPVSNLAAPGDSERKELVQRAGVTNIAHYRSEGKDRADPGTLRAFAAALGLKVAEAHRSADGSGVVALQKTDAPEKRGFIPYSDRAMNWHSDGYYNPPETRINAFILHCAQPSASGGENGFLDPEIAYIRLRDQHPALVGALLHDAAMSIPANTEPDGSVRPTSTGPVFYPDPATGRLQMRYTARTRSIAWRDDPATGEASDFLRALLQAGDPLALNIRLKAGEGVLSNNALHARTRFEDGASSGETRLLYRVRFHNRAGG